MKKSLKKIALVATFSLVSVTAALAACNGSLFISEAYVAKAEKDFARNCPSGSFVTFTIVETGESFTLIR